MSAEEYIHQIHLDTVGLTGWMQLKNLNISNIEFHTQDPGTLRTKIQSASFKYNRRYKKGTAMK